MHLQLVLLINVIAQKGEKAKREYIILGLFLTN